MSTNDKKKQQKSSQKVVKNKQKSLEIWQSLQKMTPESPRGPRFEKKGPGSESVRNF